MEIYIKNMVCNRCIMVVSGIFNDAGYPPVNVELGRVSLDTSISEEKFADIQNRLNQAGFEILSDSKKRLIEQIKNISVEYIYRAEEMTRLKFSEYLLGKLFKDYNYLSSLFSSTEGTTIEKYLINLRIERIKELLVYDEKTLSEIAYGLGYSSVAHLSAQFKKITGFSPSYFKKMGEKKRKSLDEI